MCNMQLFSVHAFMQRHIKLGEANNLVTNKCNIKYMSVHCTGNVDCFYQNGISLFSAGNIVEFKILCGGRPVL